jgi:hypothetical protein
LDGHPQDRRKGIGLPQNFVPTVDVDSQFLAIDQGQLDVVEPVFVGLAVQLAADRSETEDAPWIFKLQDV